MPSGKHFDLLISGEGDEECLVETSDKGECGGGNTKEQATSMDSAEKHGQGC